MSAGGRFRVLRSRCAQVTLSGPSLQGERRVRTDEPGYFRVLALPVGTYSLRVARLGFQPVAYERVRVRLGTTAELGDVRLTPRPVELPAVSVTGERPAIDPVSATVGSVLEAPMFEQLPTGRDYQSLVTILPHANESYFGDGLSIGGSTGLENAYYVDGVNVTDTYVGDGGTRLPYNFVQSVQVRSGGYEAEYGRALGGVVNAVTYSGGNELEGNAFGYFSHSALADEARAVLSTLRVDRFSVVDVGARLGGPIVRDRAWFSVAYNPRIERSDREIPGHGLFEDRSTLHMLAGKATWRATPRTDADLSVFGDPATRHVVGFPQGLNFSPPRAVANPEPLLNREETGGAVGALRLRQEVGGSGQLELRVSHGSTRSNQRPESGGRDDLFLFIDSENVWSGGPGVTTETASRRSAASLVGTSLVGRHTAKFGVEYEDVYLHVDQLLDFAFQLDTASFLANYVRIRGNHHNRIPAVFIQDSWQATRRLVVNAGVRWSSQYLTENGLGVVQRFPNEWQPRLGVVYQLGAPGTQRLFASYGRFYQQLPLFFSSLFYGPVDQLLSTYTEDPRLPGAQPTSTQDLSTVGSDFPEVSGVRADHSDELTLGFERLLGTGATLQVRGIHRVLRTTFGYGWDTTARPLPFVVGNHGVGELDFLPKARRTYSALELTLARWGSHRFQGQASYVLSRTHGNYTGLFSSDAGVATPGQNLALLLPEQAANSTGLLPSDRTHVVKLAGSYQLGLGLTVGSFNVIQSGTPLSELGASWQGSSVPVFLVTRGSAGRTPTIWDANLRLEYALPLPAARGSGRLVLDLLHIGSPRRGTVIEQARFLGLDESGAQTLPNPNFGKATAYQPPMAARLGLEAGF
jgi:hypothetical protein